MFFLIFKRFVLGLITLFIVSLITFIGVEILPGDACTSYLEREAFGEALEACIKRLGLDIPAHERYLSWAYNVVQGDFGYSLSGQMQINEVLGPRIKNSMVLASAAIIIGIPLALILGIIKLNDRIQTYIEVLHGFGSEIRDWCSLTCTPTLVAILSIYVYI